MTKIKNTKKGMAKKTLSMSLVVAMLATSNVPVWAAEFSDGSDVAVETEADAFVADEAETPVVEDTTEDVSAASVVESGDITTSLKVDKKSVVWADSNAKATVTGTIAAKDNASLGTVMYSWKDENGIVVGTPAQISAPGNVSIELPATKALAGKTLTLWIYSADDNTVANFNFSTNISVTIEKQKLNENATLTLGAAGTLTYKGFEQGVDVTNPAIKVTNKVNAIGDLKDSEYVLTSTTAKNADEKVTVTATATPESAYTGSISKEVSIGQKPFAKTDIEADVTTGLEYQYTGKDIVIPTDKITLKESKSEKDGDHKLGGADLSAAIKEAKIAKANTTPNNAGVEVSVTADTDKLKNFKQDETPGAVKFNGEFTTTEKVTIKKRDLSTDGTKITMKFANVPKNTTVTQLVKFLTFTGTEGSELDLTNGTDYEISVTNPKGTKVDTLGEVGDYTVTVSAKDTGNTCTGSQTLQVSVVGNVLKNATYGNTFYKPSYTGSEVKPSKADLGQITLHYVKNDNTTEDVKLQDSQWEIVGYNNNINASVYNTGTVNESNTDIKSQASVTIKLVGSGFNGETVNVPFNILPLEVKGEYIKVPENISYNKGYDKAEDYKVPVTVVAKDKDGKTAKTLDPKDFTVKYEFVKVSPNASADNTFGNKIKATVTVTNTNYIYNSSDTTKKADIVATSQPEIVAKALTDSMVVANPTTYTYTGGKITPSYYVIDGTTVLYKKGDVVDDLAEYEEVSITDAVNVGTGKINVKGVDHKGTNSGYSGKATGTFTITAANTADVKVSFTNKAERNYTGKQIRPRSIKVTLNGNDVTNQFEVVSYGENISGTGTVVLKPVDGNKNFTGANVTAEFNIVKEEVKADLKAYDSKGLEISEPNRKFDYDGTAHTFTKVLLSNIKKTNDEKTSAKASDFEIKYVDNIAGKQTSDSSYNVGYVYAVAKDGTGFAGTDTITTADGTIIKGVVAKLSFKIYNVKFVAKNVTIKNGTYAAGLPVKPEVLIQIGGTTLVEGKDYKLTLVDKTSTGTVVAPTDVTAGKIYGVKIEGINGYTGSVVTTNTSATDGSEKLVWGVDKKNINDCTVTVKDGVVTVLNGYIPVASTEYTAKNNGDGTYTVTANSTSKNYTGSKTVKADGKAEDEKPNAPMISSVKVVGNKATVILSGDSDGAAGYDYVISTDRDCITNKDYASVNKNQVQTSTTFKYVQQGTYYAYCHAWKRDANGKKVFSDWSNAYPFVVSAITPDAPVITNVKVSGSTIKVTYKAAANATGYDVVLGTGSKKENGETRPYQYGNHKKLNLKEGTVTATFKNVPKGTWVVGMHAFNRTSEDGKKVFSPWSNLKKATVK